MSPWLWGVVLVVSAWVSHWGAEQVTHPLKKIRQQFGFTQVAGAALVGLAAASPEIGINVASALRGVSDIGLGASLGSNIIAIPLVVTVAYWATRKGLKEGEGGGEARPGSGEDSEGDEGEGPEDHERHRREGLLRVHRRAVSVQALPYLAIVGLVAALILPAPWRGLQPVDGYILLGAYLAYLSQALLRGRGESETVKWTKGEVALALAGAAALAVGAYFIVRSTENIASAIGIERIVAGIFITAPMAALPELFAVWSVSRSGQVTAAATSVIADHAVTLTVALFPLALAALPVKDLTLLSVNLAFVAGMPATFAALIHWGGREHGFSLREVLILDGLYLIYLAVMFIWVLNVF